MVPLLPHSLRRASTGASARCRMESHVAWPLPVGLGLPHTWFARKTVLAVLRVRGQTMIRAGVGDTETRGQQRVRRQLEHAILFEVHVQPLGSRHGHFTSPARVSDASVFACSLAGHLVDQRVRSRWTKCVSSAAKSTACRGSRASRLC